MADWYPGAWRVPGGSNGGKITARPAENILHIAASNWNIDENAPTSPSKGIAGWTLGEKSCNGYNDQYGNFQQYCGVFDQVNGTKDGNWRNRTWESWNPEGLNGTAAQYNSSTWTAAQCERFSDLLAWDAVNNGALLQDMRNSLRTSHGVGAHRYGVDSAGPFSRISGGELWTKNAGKSCPGTARVNQLGGIITRAQVLAAGMRNGSWGTLPPGRVNLSQALSRKVNVDRPANPSFPTPNTPKPATPVQRTFLEQLLSGKSGKEA